MAEFAHLFQPGYFGKLKVKNRLVLPPMVRNYADFNGSSNPRYEAHIERIARGGVGTRILPADSVVMCLGAVSSSKLARSLDRKTRLLTVGDAFKPRKVTEAMAEGAAAALTL